MLGGDISNELAPTIVIDLDNLVILSESKLFGFAKSLRVNKKSVPVLDTIMYRGIGVYLVGHGYDEKEQAVIQGKLDDVDFPYTKLSFMKDNKEKEMLLSRRHIHFYFYNNPLHASVENKRKEKWVQHVGEIYHYGE